MNFDPNSDHDGFSEDASLPALSDMTSTMSPVERTLIQEAREVLRKHLNQNPVLSDWSSLMNYCALTVRGPEERFHVIYLDRKNRLIADEKLAVGTVDHVPVYPREVIKRGLILNASAMILVHKPSVW